jgi:hypothetical protein
MNVDDMEEKQQGYITSEHSHSIQALYEIEEGNAEEVLDRIETAVESMFDDVLHGYLPELIQYRNPNDPEAPTIVKHTFNIEGGRMFTNIVTLMRWY